MQLPSCGPGSNPKHNVKACFFNLYLSCVAKRTKISQKRPALDHIIFDKKLYFLTFCVVTYFNLFIYSRCLLFLCPNLRRRCRRRGCRCRRCRRRRSSSQSLFLIGIKINKNAEIYTSSFDQQSILSNANGIHNVRVQNCI